MSYLAPVLAVVLGSYGPELSKPEPCKVNSQGFVEVSHLPASPSSVCVLRMRGQRSLRVVVRHAVPFAYQYSTEGVELPSEDLSGPLSKLLGLETQAKAAAEQEKGAGQAAEFARSAAQGFYGAIANLEEIRREVDSTAGIADEVSENDSTLQRRIRQRYGAIVAKGDSLFSKRFTEAGVRAVLAEGYDEAINSEEAKKDKEVSARLKPILDAANQALPGIFQLLEGLRNYRVGPQELLYTYSGTGEFLVRIKITYRFGGLGLAPNRQVGSIDVAEVRPEFKTVRFSSGLQFEFAGDSVFRVDPIEPQAGDTGPQRYTVSTEPAATRLRTTPSVFIDVMAPLSSASRWSAGLTFGVGIASTDLRQIDDKTILSALATVGYQNVFFSGGVASVAKTIGLEGVGASGETTDPNVLTKPRTTRDARFIFGMHYAF